jgi:hypothetical protein
MIQLLMVSLCVIYFRVKPVGAYKKFMLFIILLDALLSANLNMPFTGYNVRFPVAEIQKKLGMAPKGLQVNSSALLKNSTDDYKPFYPIYLNTNIYRKEIAIDGYNVFIIKPYDQFTSNEYFKKIIENKFYFLAENAPKDSSNIGYYTADNAAGNKHWINLSNEDNSKAELKTFSANGMSFSAQNCKNKILVVYQNLLPGHHFYVNGKNTEPLRINGAIIGIPINEEHAEVSYVYDPKGVKSLFVISAISFLCFSGIAFFFSIFERKRPHPRPLSEREGTRKKTD